MIRKEFLSFDQKRFSLEQFNLLFFFLLVEFFFLVILYKVLQVPITHDETATTVHYSRYGYWQIMMYPDNWPNNHILNTILVKFLISVFGATQFVVRLPNLLSFLVYAFAVFRINKAVLKTSSVFFIPASIFFLCNPYFLDFFGLCRGYGMSCALGTLSLSYLITGFSTLKDRHIGIGLFLSMLASYANFTLLVFWVAAIIISCLYFPVRYGIRKWKPALSILVVLMVSIAYAGLIATPILKMQSSNQFRFWESAGFFKETIVPLVNLSLYGSKRFSPEFIRLLWYFPIFLLIADLVYLSVALIRSKFSVEILRRPLFISAVALALTSGISIAQCILLKTPNLYGRTALFFFPLFIILLVSTIGLISDRRALLVKGAFSFLLGAALLFQIADRTSLKYVKEWWFDANTLEVIDYFNKAVPDQKVTLKTNWLFQPSFYFYKCTGKIPLIDLQGYDKSIDTNTTAQYYYIKESDYKLLESRFEVVYKVNPKRWLLKRRPETAGVTK